MNQKHKRLLFLLLIMMGAPFTVMAQDAHPAAQEVGTYHWQDGCTQDGKVCGRQMYRDGLALLSLTVNGVSVDIVLVDTGKVMLVATSVGNDTRQTIDVVPQLFSLNAVKPKPKNLSFLAPDLFERKTGKVADSDVNWMMTALALAKSRMTTETRLSAVKGGDPASSKPDSKGKDEDESGRERGVSYHRIVHEVALRASIVPPRCFVTGIVFFEGDKEATQLQLRIPAGGYVFEFPFVRR